MNALELLSEADLVCMVTIRGEPLSPMWAVNRQVGYCALHVGQMVLLARHFPAHRWKSLSAPGNRSAAFSRQGGNGTVQSAINYTFLNGYTKH
jgi:hypothetical protein